MRFLLELLLFSCFLVWAQEAPAAQPAFPDHVRVPDERVKTLYMFSKKDSHVSQPGQEPISCPSVCASAFVFIKQVPSCTCYDWDLAAPTAIEELAPGESEFWVSSLIDKRLPLPNYEFRPPPREGNSVKYSVTELEQQTPKTNAECATHCDSRPECVGYWWTEELGGACKYYSKIRADETLGESFADRMLYFKSSALIQIIPPQGYGFLPETITIPRPLADRLNDQPVSDRDTSTPQVAKYLFNQLEGAKVGINVMDACKAECDAANLCLGFLWSPTSIACSLYQSIILDQYAGQPIPAGETIYIKTSAVVKICGLPDFLYQNGMCVDSTQIKCEAPGVINDQGQCVAKPGTEEPTTADRTGDGSGTSPSTTGELQVKRFELKPNQNVHVIGDLAMLLDLTGPQDACKLNPLPQCDQKGHFEVTLPCQKEQIETFFVVATPCLNGTEPGGTAFFAILGHVTASPSTLVLCNHRKGTENPIDPNKYTLRDLKKPKFYFHSEMLHHDDKKPEAWKKFKMEDHLTVGRRFTHDDFNVVQPGAAVAKRKRGLLSFLEDAAESLAKFAQLPIEELHEYKFNAHWSSDDITLFEYNHSDQSCKSGFHTSLAVGASVTAKVDINLDSLVGIHAIGTLFPLEVKKFLVYASVGGNAVLTTTFEAHIDYRIWKNLKILDLDLTPFTSPELDVYASPYAQLKASGTLISTITMDFPDFKVHYDAKSDDGIVTESSQPSYDHEFDVDITLEGRIGVKVTPELRIGAKIFESDSLAVDVAVGLPIMAQFYMNSDLCMSVDGSLTIGFKADILGRSLGKTFEPFPLSVWRNENCANANIDMTDITTQAANDNEQNGKCPEFNGYFYKFTEENYEKAIAYLEKSKNNGGSVPTEEPNGEQQPQPTLKRRTLLTKRQVGRIENFNQHGPRARFEFPEFSWQGCEGLPVPRNRIYEMNWIGKTTAVNYDVNSFATLLTVSDLNVFYDHGNGLDVFKRNDRIWKCWVSDAGPPPPHIRRFVNCYSFWQQYNPYIVTTVTELGLSDLAAVQPSPQSVAIFQNRPMVFHRHYTCFFPERDLVAVEEAAQTRFEAMAGNGLNPIYCGNVLFDYRMTYDAMRSDAVAYRKYGFHAVGISGNRIAWGRPENRAMIVDYNLDDLRLNCQFFEGHPNMHHLILLHTRAGRPGYRNGRPFDDYNFGIRAFYVYDTLRNAISDFCGFYSHFPHGQHPPGKNANSYFQCPTNVPSPYTNIQWWSIP